MPYKFQQKYLLLILCCQCLFINCNMLKTNKGDNSKEPSTQNILSIDGEWKLYEFHNQNIKIDKSTERSIPLLGINTSEMKIHGRDGCNTIFGTMVKLENNSIEIGKIGGTKMYCGNEFYDDVFRRELLEARMFEIKAQKLFLFNNDGNKTLEFDRMIEAKK